MIVNNGDAVVAAMPDVVGAMAELTGAKAELTTAQKQLDLANRDLILAKQAKDYSEGRTNLTDAESNLLAAQAKVTVAEQSLTNAQGDGHAEVWKAQQILKKTGGAIPISGGLEPRLPTTYELPTGPYADPFSKDSAELRSRVTKGTLPRHLTQALGPNHRYIAGTVAVGSTNEEAEITPEPSGVEAPADETPQTVEG